MEPLYMALAGLAFTGFALFATERSRLPFAHALVLTVSCLTLGGFVTGIAGIYAVYSRAFLFCGLALLAVFGAKRWRKAPEHEICERLSPPLFAAALLFFVWYFQGVKLVYYDEFFWGNLAKELISHGKFADYTDVISKTHVPANYPPGPSILQTLFMGQNFNETGMALGGMLTVLILFFTVYHFASKRMERLPALALALLLACTGRCMGTLINTFGFYRIGYAEYLQGSIFAALLCFAFYEKDRRKRYCALFPGIIFLSLFKGTGWLFACGVLACMIPDFWSESKARSIKAKIPDVIKKAAPFLAGMALVAGIWQAHLYGRAFWAGEAYIKDIEKFQAILSQVYEIDLEDLDSSLIYQAIAAMGKAMLKRPLIFSPNIPEHIINIFTGTISILLQMGLAFALLARYRLVKIEKREKNALLLLLAGLLGWLLLRLYVGLAHHNQAEIMRAASFERYVGSYMAGITTVACTMIYFGLSETKTAAARLATPLLMAHLAIMLFICAFNPFARPGTLPGAPNIAAMAEVASFLEKNTPSGSKIWYIEQGATKDKGWILTFMLEPERHAGIPPWRWNLGEKSKKIQDDTFPSQVKPEEIYELCMEYDIDFILLWKLDKAFIRTYGSTLGLADASSGPVLLKLDAWLEGKSAYPEKAGNQTQK